MCLCLMPCHVPGSACAQFGHHGEHGESSVGREEARKVSVSCQSTGQSRPIDHPSPTKKLSSPASSSADDNSAPDPIGSSMILLAFKVPVSSSSPSLSLFRDSSYPVPATCLPWTLTTPGPKIPEQQTTRINKFVAKPKFEARSSELCVDIVASRL